MKKKTKKTKRKKPGYKVIDRVCGLCSKWIPKDKCLNLHHISYKLNIVVPLHYLCHSVVHCRVRFLHPYMKKYGKDLGAFLGAHAVVKMYEKYPEVIKEIEGAKNEK